MRLAHCCSLNLLTEETIKLEVSSSHSFRAVESLYEAQCSKILLQTLTNQSVTSSAVYLALHADVSPQIHQCCSPRN